MRSRRVLALLAPLVGVLALIAASRGQSRPGVAPTEPVVPASADAKRGPVARAPRAPDTAPVGARVGGAPWDSPEACAAALSTRPKRKPGTAQLGTWNVRWFPDGGPGRPRLQPGGRGHGPTATNLDWLACAIAWLDVDVLALQELKSTPEASDALGKVRERLDALTGGSFRAEIDRCPGKGRQSVALLFDEKRVAARGFQNLASLNPKGGACEGQLRPGFGGYFRFPGGLDLHVVAVHLKSGPARHEYDLRQVSLEGIPRAFHDAQTQGSDDDLVLLGDFNTMGCPDCSPKIAATDEVTAFDARLTALSPPFERVPANQPCTQYYRGRGTQLDHFVMRKGIREISPGTSSRVEGYCAEAGCKKLSGQAMPRAYRELSDHCPVVLELTDRDVD